MKSRTGKHRGFPYRVVADGKRFRGQWLCGTRNGYYVVCGRWYKTEGGAQRGIEREIDKVLTGAGVAPGETSPLKFPGFAWKNAPYAERRKRNPDHRCAAPGELTSKERGELPDRAYALPKQRKYPLYSLDSAGKLQPDPSHASNAKARATQQHNAGKLSKSKRDEIHRKADKVLAKCKRDNPADPGAEWPVLKHAPAAIAGRDLAELGKALEVEAGGLQLKFTKHPHLYWDPRSKTLVWFQGGKRGRATNPELVDRKAAAAFESFMGRDVERERRHTMPRMPNGVWRRAGRAGRVDYWSDKFNPPPQEYTHPITSAVNLYRGGGPEPPWIWMLRGGKLRVTRRGIEG